jgi:hypothetical protein
MQIVINGNVRQFAEIEHGSIFIGQIGKSNFICMKSFIKLDNDQGTVDAVISLFPGHPNYGGAPGYFVKEVLRTNTVFELSEVQFEVSDRLDHVQLESGYEAVIGAVYVRDGNVYLCVAADRGLAFVHLQSGELVPRYDHARHAQVRSWRLTRRIQDKIEELVIYDVP